MNLRREGLTRKQKQSDHKQSKNLGRMSSRKYTMRILILMKGSNKIKLKSSQKYL